MGLSGEICGCSRLLAPGLTLGFVLSLSDSLSEICELLSFGRKNKTFKSYILHMTLFRFMQEKMIRTNMLVCWSVELCSVKVSGRWFRELCGSVLTCDKLCPTAVLRSKLFLL